ncbi:HSP20 family protein [Streptomyces sp. SAI-208]|jgi:HSP20 family protein|uniref:Hsp20/alpha crystallin family protein n=1 Tax=unclassified Streptomyces TaxID=2593676 RepID=UPI002476A3D0|nr:MULTISPECIES: Hsp20/alpha crystallin family protein [unclassified Streptomyces]MDH6514135.1 HSP20 family protein [Streptomyces sp. SAI-090]MDH6546314.1 HSP20 family protein [Streptomyces sp. SAI-041]MDH6565411.1 HSP20 family protein [Streptomyces sp. SAI-117]MDH6589674.1 HSP20 family protein [Streptomyces sp. SAI-133]MDH6604973.1 HSP20 family protein [Streptomyces sp. SAI-208]
MLARTGGLGDLDRLTHQLANPGAPEGTVIPADAWRDDAALYLQFDLPGMDRSSIELTTEQHTLTLTAERPSPIPADARPVLTERPTGRFTRRLALSDALDTAAAEAAYDNGVLTLRIPLAAHAKPRKIAVSGGTLRQLTA